MGEGVPVRAADVADTWVDGFVADTLGDYGEVRVSDSADLARHVLRGLSEAADHARFTVIDNETGALLAAEQAGECTEEHDVTGPVTVRTDDGRERTVEVTFPHLACCVPEGYFRFRPVLGEAAGG